MHVGNSLHDRLSGQVALSITHRGVFGPHAIVCRTSDGAPGAIAWIFSTWQFAMVAAYC